MIIVSTEDEPGHPVILAVLKRCEKKTVKDFLRSILKKLRATVKQVGADLYDNRRALSCGQTNVKWVLH